MEAKKNTRGGKREGAGRKPKGESAKIPISLRLDPAVVSIIESQPNQAEFVEQAVKAFAK
jgi:hypothetical protein